MTRTNGCHPQKTPSPATAELALPPQNLGAEQALLGQLLMSPDLAAEIESAISPDDCYLDDHRRAFAVGFRLAREGVPPDAAAVAVALGQDPDIGPQEAERIVTEAMARTYPGAHWHPDALAIRRCAQQRALVGIGRDMTREASRLDADVESVVTEAYGALRIVEERQSGSAAAVPASDCALEFLQDFSSGKPRGIPTGFRDFDELTGGLKPGAAVIIAARPSVGKTLLAGNMACNLARDGRPVLFLTLELTRLELFSRFVSAESRIPSRRIEGRSMNEHEHDAMTSALNMVSSWPLFLDDRPKTMAQLSAVARFHHRRDKIQSLFVDYLGLLTPDDRKAPREQQVSAMSRQLKLVAKELGIPVVVLCQLNRQIEARGGADRRPRLDDLRESGAIEQDADVVAFLDRPRIYDPDADPTEGRVFVRKNRSGPTGEFRLDYRAETFTFSDCQSGSEQGQSYG